MRAFATGLVATGLVATSLVLGTVALAAPVAAQSVRYRRPFFGGGGGTPRPGRKLTPADVRAYGDAALYDLTTLRTIFLQFESNDWESELEAFHNTDVEVPATMTVDGKTYKDVGVHFRGESSYMMTPAGFKRSLNVSIDFAHEAQHLGGFHTLNLLNAANTAIGALVAVALVRLL